MKYRQQHASKAIWLFLGLLASGFGCGRYSHVNWRNPGTAEMQQNRAVAQHDPYPDPDAGPEVLGGRPLSFDTPPPEPAWLQKRASPFFGAATGNQPQYHAQPVYTTPAYSPNVLTPTAQPNYTTPAYQPSYTPPLVPQQQPAPPGPSGL